MKKFKGFTLVELLAILVILGIIALIVVPTILNIINDSKEATFVSDTRTLLKTSDLEYTKNESNGEVIYCKSKTDSNNLLKVSGKDYYYYIKKGEGKPTIAVIWDEDNYIKKVNNKGINVADISDSDILKLEIEEEITCKNVIEVLGVLPKVDTSNLNLSVVTKEDWTNKNVSLEMKVANSSTNDNLNKVTYKVYRKKDTDTNYPSEVLTSVDSTDKANDFIVNYIDNQIDFYSNYKYKVVAYDEYDRELLSKEVERLYCFVAGTKVLTENGYKNIEDIKIGEKVYSYNLDNNNLELKEVLDTIESSTTETYKMTIGSEELEMSKKHQLYIIDKGWVRANDVKVGDQMLSTDKKIVTINKIKEVYYDKPIKTYNLTIDSNNNYFVTNIQVLVHNAPSIK